nr:RNA-directed DNA polymerase, eukaryota [Tanacetum cinerariifolium]
ETFKIIVKGKVFMVRAKELFTWNPTFVPPKAIVYSSDDDSIQAVSENDVHPGLGNKTKKGWIRELSVKYKLNFIAIQETKMESVSYMDVKAMWGNSNFDFVCSDSQGNLGGILCIWEMSMFRKDHVTISDSFIAIYETWLPINSKLLLVSIYAPQQAAYKRVLWEYMSILLGRWNGDAILMGDFNEVHSREERQGSCFNPYSARVFDNFISSSG